MKQIGTGHLHSHGITAREYKKKFPDSKLTATSVKKKIAIIQKEVHQSRPELAQRQSEVIRRQWKDPEKRAAYLEGMKSRPAPTDSMKKKISDTMKEVYAKGHTLSEINKNQGGKNNNFYGNTHQDINKFSNGRYEDKFRPLMVSIGFIPEFIIANDVGRVAARIDFADHQKKIAIEIDSSYHNKRKIREKDEVRDLFLIESGWSVYRIKTSKDPAVVERRLYKLLEELGYEDQVHP